MRNSDQRCRWKQGILAPGKSEVEKGLLHKASQRRNVAPKIAQKSSTGECRHCMELEICLSLGASGQSLPRCDTSRSQNKAGGDQTEKRTLKAL